jgi:hypothetical protein
MIHRCELPQVVGHTELGTTHRALGTDRKE